MPFRAADADTSNEKAGADTTTLVELAADYCCHVCAPYAALH